MENRGRPSAARAHTNLRAAVFESRECIGITNINQANCIDLQTFSVREQFAAAFALAPQMAKPWNPSVLGKASHWKPVDDKWQMILPLSPNHPAQVFKKCEP